jgi:hypothetical protein
MIEVFRRLVVLACFCTAIGLAYYAPLDPLVMVKPVEPEKIISKQVPPEGTGGAHPGLLAPLIPPEDRARLRPKREYLVLKVEGPIWRDFFTKVIETTKGRSRTGEWKWRFPADAHALPVLFFRPDERPLQTLSAYFRPNSERFRIMLEEGGKQAYLEIDYRTYSDSQFLIGSGMTSYPHPPARLFFPYRTTGLWIALAGLCFYFVLPAAKRLPGALCYDRWRVGLGDLVGYAFTLLPLALPIFVVGGTKQGYTEGWPLLLLFGLIVPLGLFSLYLTTWFGSFQLVLGDQELGIKSFRGVWNFNYEDMNYFQAVVIKPPRWLIILSWIMVLASAGAARLGAAGRAMLLGSSAASSLAIEMKSGQTLSITLSDQMGSGALKGFEQIAHTLKKQGVGEKKEERVIRSLGFETVRLVKSFSSGKSNFRMETK